MFSFKINPAKTALVVVDMQNDFVEEGAPIRFPGAVKVMPKLKELIHICRGNDIPVIYTMETHREDGSDMGLMADIWPLIKDRKGLIKGTRGVDIYKEIAPRPGDIVIEKRRYSAFHGTDLEMILRNKEIDTLIITGGATDCCCLATAIEAQERDFKVVFMSDLTATFEKQTSDGSFISVEEIQRVICTILGVIAAQIMEADELIKNIGLKTVRV